MAGGYRVVMHLSPPLCEPGPLEGSAHEGPGTPGPAKGPAGPPSLPETLRPDTRHDPEKEQDRH